jgi:predicted chitinase
MTATALKNPKLFFDTIREDGGLFRGSMSSSQVAGINAILAEDAKFKQDPRWLAYELATAFHETARTMQPVRETKAANDNAAIAILDKAFATGQLPWVKSPYWRKDADGKSWLGRGLVQLTHKRNYEILGKAVGADLVADPDRAMESQVAVDIMFVGMRDGLFTGKSLADYFNSNNTDWVNARRIINGVESAEKVAGYAKAFYMALKNAA